MAGSINIKGTIATVPPGSLDILSTLTPSTSDLVQIFNAELSSGPNGITVPPWATAILIEPDPTNTETLTLKGISGDTGIEISPTAPTLLSFPASPVDSIILAAGADFTTQTTFTFF